MWSKGVHAASVHITLDTLSLDAHTVGTGGWTVRTEHTRPGGAWRNPCTPHMGTVEVDWGLNWPNGPGRTGFRPPTVLALAELASRFYTPLTSMATPGQVPQVAPLAWDSC